MIGCMVSTSLSMAPAIIVAQQARVVDLDGPLLLANDRDNGLRYDGSLVHPPLRRCGARDRSGSRHRLAHRLASGNDDIVPTNAIAAMPE